MEGGFAGAERFFVKNVLQNVRFIVHLVVCFACDNVFVPYLPFFYKITRCMLVDV